MNYLYPPLTLLLARAAGSVPSPVRAATFWLMYAAGIGMVLRLEQLVFLATAVGERRLVFILTPLCVFFPGLLNDDFVLAGNVAPILYGLTAAAAYTDHKNRQWRWFYLAVLFASLFKPSMLSLLMIPILSGGRQWIKAGSVGLAGCAIFSFQGLLWPDSFHSYKLLMKMELAYNNEFGFNPAGEIAKILLDHRLGYNRGAVIFYCCFAAATFWVLLCCSRHYQQGRVSASHWFPVMLIGVVLLNPRLKQYDAAVLTLPLALVGWRACVAMTTTRRQAQIAAFGLFAVGNILVGRLDVWDGLETAVTLGLFTVSAWQLLSEGRVAARHAPDIAACRKLMFT